MRGRQLVDIGANLLDPMFQGVYRGKAKHPGDLGLVLERAWEAGLAHIVVTAGSLQETRQTLAWIETREDKDRFSCTLGFHPTRAQEWDPSLLPTMLQLVQDHPQIVAIGECGLDWERLEFCPKEQQLLCMEGHFALTEATGLPLFLHNRASSTQLLALLREHRSRWTSGVVHSFDGTVEALQSFLELGLYIGINGCSLRTPENLEVVRHIPLNRLLLETDAPWCSLKPSHASWAHVQTRWAETKKPEKHEGLCVKGRNEPCALVQVLEAVAGIRGEDPEAVALASKVNAQELFALRL